MPPDSQAPVHVLNPAGRDPERLFTDGPGRPGDPGHPPVNHHAYAACTGGGFYRDEARIPSGGVIVLLRPRHLDRAARAIDRLHRRGHRVAVTVKEAGATQFAGSFADPARWQGFCEVAARADFFIAPTREMELAFRGAGALGGGFIPTPYPLDFSEWDFSCPLSGRSGVFVGTREFDAPSRRHLIALAALASLKIPATVVNCDGRHGERLLRALSPDFRIIAGPLPYPDYLTLMASHRVVFQLDGSRVPGQVAGDALLCRMPCIGGDGAIDRLAFGGGPMATDSVEDVLDHLHRLLTDDDLWFSTVRTSQESAAEALSYAAVARRLREFFG